MSIGRNWRAPLFAALACAVALAGGALLAWGFPGQPRGADDTAIDRQAQSWGIKPLPPMVSASGYMLDFRYDVTDPEKARALLSADVRPYLVHEKTGAKLLVPSSPKVGALRQSTAAPREGGRYFVMFANPGRLVKSGDSVSVILGQCRLDGLTVH